MASTFLVNQSVKITKLVVDRAPIPATGQTMWRDSELKGFGLRVTAGGAKSFILEKRVNGRVRRMTLGRYPGITAEQARREAQKLLGQIITGHDPKAEREAAQLRGVTLREAFADFLKARKNLKPRTAYDYGRLIAVSFPDWQGRALTTISKDEVGKRHQKLGTERGGAYANGAMRVLRAVFNFSQAQYEDASGRSILPENPVSRLTHTRAWYRVSRRQTVIRSHQLAVWYQAVMALKDKPIPYKSQSLKAPHPNTGEPLITDTESKHGDSADPQPSYVTLHSTPLRIRSGDTVADYLLLLLFTGLRRSEAATLQWEHVDLIGRTLTIPDPKNHEPLTLPLSDVVYELLTARAADAVNGQVFPGSGREGRLIEPRAQIARVIKTSGVAFTLHDLRRTFITIADSIDIPAYAIKRLVNHKMRGDVTAGYIVSDVERLRRPMQQITDYILRCVQQETTPKVVPLPVRRAIPESA